MPFAYGIKRNLFKTVEKPLGTVISSQLVYSTTRQYNTPNREQRAKPPSIHAFSLSNTSRQYYNWNEDTAHEIIMRGPTWNGSYLRDPVGYVSSPAPGFPGWLLAAPDTLTHLRLKIKDQKASLGIALMQYRQTCSMFYRAATYLSRVFRDRKRYLARLIRYRKRLRRARRGYISFTSVGPKPKAPKGTRASDIYLAYAFGLRPLISDLYGAVEVLSDRLADDDVWLPVRTSAVNRAFRQRTSSSSITPEKTIETVNQETIVRHKGVYRIGSGALKNAALLGATNPLEVAWDFIPFSFIVNAIVPIGTWLKSLDALVGIAEVRHYKTTKFSSLQELRVMTQITEYKSETLDRGGVSTVLPVPPLPSYKPSRSLGLVVAGLALLDQIKHNRDYATTYLTRGRF